MLDGSEGTGIFQGKAVGGDVSEGKGLWERFCRMLFLGKMRSPLSLR